MRTKNLTPADRPKPQLRGFRDLANESGLSYHAIRQLALTGAIPVVKVGPKRLYIHQADWDAWLIAATARRAS